MFYLDSIKYDVTIQKPALQHGIYEHVRVRAIKIKPVMLRASLMYAFRRAYMDCPTTWLLSIRSILQRMTMGNLAVAANSDKALAYLVCSHER